MSSSLDEVMYQSDSSSTDSKQMKKAASNNTRRRCRQLLPTFYNEHGTTRPFYLFPLFLLINIITMADRAIIPGASQEFLGFLGSAFDSPRVVKENPDAGLVRLLYILFTIYCLIINDDALSSRFIYNICLTFHIYL